MSVTDFTTYTIYRIVCFATGNVYVGQTNNVTRRKKEHFKELRSNTHFNSHLQRAYNKYGEQSFYFECLENDIPPTLIDEREIHWIKHFDCRENGFNMTVGGESAGANKKPCTWNGIDYPSIKHAAKANGITASSMTSRIIKGYTRDADMLGVGGNPTNLRSCTWNGINYPSLRAAATANNVSIASMKQRLDNGYKTDDDMSRISSPKSCVWNGIEYPSQTAAAKANGMVVTTFHKQLKKGNQYSNLRVKTCTWNGIIYDSISAAAEANGISTSGMSDRIKAGYACDDDIPYHPTITSCTWNGVVYQSIRKAAIAAGISSTVMSKRINKGYVCDDDLPEIGSSFRKVCEWNGIEYRSITEAAKAIGVSTVCMKGRVRRGWKSDNDIPGGARVGRMKSVT